MSYDILFIWNILFAKVYIIGLIAKLNHSFENMFLIFLQIADMLRSTIPFFNRLIPSGIALKCEYNLHWIVVRDIRSTVIAIEHMIFVALDSASTVEHVIYHAAPLLLAKSVESTLLFSHLRCGACRMHKLI